MGKEEAIIPRRERVDSLKRGFAKALFEREEHTSWQITRDLEKMSWKEFASSGMKLFVNSKLVGGQIILAADNASLVPNEEKVVYRAAEFAQLSRLDAAEIRAIHWKKVSSPSSSTMGE